MAASIDLAAPMLAVAVITVTAQGMGALAQRCHQPRVVGEIVGGIVLGPSVLGVLAPGLESHLFTQSVRGQLTLLGQLGLVLFMFLVGLELNPNLLMGRLPLASRITAAGLVVPLTLGVLLAGVFETWLPDLLPGHHLLSGALFMGTAMAITAFPVLARILRDRGLQNQSVGALAITTAAIDDALAWILLAAVVALARSASAWGALGSFVGTASWALVVLVGTRPLRRWLEHHYRQGRDLGPLLQAVLFSGALFSAVVTEWLGVHLIFGAFLWGLAMPRYAPLRRRLEAQLETVVLRLLLPLFFAISGLSTRIGSLNSWALWLALLAVLVVAVCGKFLGTWATARLCGVESREAQALGWLMNTRGLTELVVLNVGLAQGVISTELFTIGVLMALVTTVMTGPLLGRLGYGVVQPPNRRVAVAEL